MVDYLINANYFTKDEVVSLSNEIRSNYDWNNYDWNISNS